MNFNGDDLLTFNLSRGVHHAYPSQIKHLPIHEGAFSGSKNLIAEAQARPASIMRECARNGGCERASYRQQSRAPGRSPRRRQNLFIDLSARESAKAEHLFSLGHRDAPCTPYRASHQPHALLQRHIPRIVADFIKERIVLDIENLPLVSAS